MSLVSVIMPAYNAEKTIAKSIDSVLSQTFVDWEFIIVNDMSTDNTAKVVESFIKNGHPIKLITNKKNIGVAATRNIAISHATGKYVAFLDSDDVWHRDKLLRHMAFLKKTNGKISFTATKYINEMGKVSSYTLPAKSRLYYRDLLKANSMSCSSVVACRKLVMRYPFQRGNLHEDYLTWLQALKEVGCAYGLNEPLLMYRMVKGSRSSNRVESAKMLYRTYCALGYSSCMSFMLTIRYALGSISKRAKIKRISSIVGL